MNRLKRNQDRMPHGVALLELLLLLACLSLLVQLFPDIWLLLDVRTWPAWVWFSINALACSVLCLKSYAPDVLDDIIHFRWLLSATSITSRHDNSKDKKKMALDEERKLYQRMKEARRRQIY
jgi:hypothetical protein